MRAQILLDRARFSPGQIDGRYGGDLGIAVKGYQEEDHLNPDGIIGTQMWQFGRGQAAAAQDLHHNRR